MTGVNRSEGVACDTGVHFRVAIRVGTVSSSKSSSTEVTVSFKGLKGPIIGLDMTVTSESWSEVLSAGGFWITTILGPVETLLAIEC